MSAVDDGHAAERRMRWALVSAVATVAMVTTLGVPVIPTIAAERDVSLESAQWVLTITLLVGAVATPVLGRLGDGARRDRVLLATLATVVIGSIVAATASSFSQVLVGRALQGVGYGTLPLAVSVAREHLPAARLRGSVATLSVTVAIGVGLGFPLTGLIASVFDSNAAFWFGGAFSAGALIAVALSVPRSPPSASRIALDVPGAALLAAGLAALLLGLSRAGAAGWGATDVLAALGGAAAALLAFAVVELRVERPLIDLRLVAQRAVLGANVASVLMAAAMYISLSLVNRLAQTPTSTGYGLGASAAVAGLLLLPLSVASFVFQPVALGAANRLGLKVVLPVGAMVVGLSQVSLGLLHGRLWELALSMALLGVGIGATFAMMPTLITASVPSTRTGSAMSLHQVLRSAGGAIGSAASVTILAGHTTSSNAFADVSGYTVAFAVGFAMCAAAAVAAFVLIPTDHGLAGGRDLEPNPDPTTFASGGTRR